MLATTVTNEDTGKVVGQVATSSIQSGVSSPFPTDATAPVPSTNLTVASKEAHEITYMTGDAITVSADGRPFQGHLNSSQVAETGGLATMSIDHITSALNQDIVTLPVFSTGHDNGYGAGILIGAMSHWAAECGLFVNGVRGNVLMGIHNIAPGIGYYHHDTTRYLGVEYEAGNNYLQWVPTESNKIDPGISLTTGESLKFVIGMNLFGGTHPRPTVGGKITFASSVLGDVGLAGEVSSFVEPSLEWTYTTATGNFLLRETTKTSGAAAKTAINYVAAPTSVKNPSFIEITATRTAEKTLTYACRTVFGTTFPAPETSSSGTVTNSYVPAQLSATQVILDTYLYAPSTRKFTGIESFYISRGGVPNTTTYWEDRGHRSVIGSLSDPGWNYTVVPGMSGNAWQMLNDLASVYRLVYAPQFGSLVSPGDFVTVNSSGTVRPTSGASLSTQVREMAETVEVVNYDYRYSRDSFSPIQLYVSDTAYSVGLGERQEHTVQTDSTFTLLEQPQCVTVPTAIKSQRDPTIGRSLYSVYDSDNLEVDPNTWNDSGGFISVESTTTPGEMKLVIQAPTNALSTRKPPFIISIESSIPSLIISGLGAKSAKKTITSYTGAGDGINVKKIGTTYDNPLVAKNSQAWEVAVLLGSLYGTTPSTLSANLESIGLTGLDEIGIRYRSAYYIATQSTTQNKRLQLNGSVRFTPIQLFNNDYSNMTCGQFNSLFVGKSIRYLNISPLQD